MDPPVIISQPDDQSGIVTGNVIIFMVVVIGTELVYQWRKDGNDLNEDSTYVGVNTLTLIVLNVTMGEVGDYSCFISNDVGNITSNTAELMLWKLCIFMTSVCEVL